MNIDILIADDHRIMREGLRALLEKQLDFDVLGEADDGRTIVQLAQQLRPDVVIMDISMPTLNGIEATQQLLETLPQIRVIGLSMHFEKRFVDKMLKAGAYGYLRKVCSSEEVIRALRTVMAGKFYISDGISNVTVKTREQYFASTKATDVSILTPKEREILQLIAEGKLTKQIAYGLSLSVKTVEKHRHNIMEKLGLHSIAELTKFAINEGMTTLG